MRVYAAQRVMTLELRTEHIPLNAPEAWCKSVNTTCFVDTDHAGYKRIRRFYIGVTILINSAPNKWFSKHQNTVELSTFGPEFIDTKQSIDLSDYLIYVLRIMSVLTKDLIFLQWAATHLCSVKKYTSMK